MDLYSEIKKIRQTKGWSQAQLASIAGTTQQHVSLIEKGRARMELETLRKLLDALGYALALEEAPVRELLAARQKNWRRFSESEESRLEPDSPSARLARVGELASLYQAMHGLSFPDGESLRRQAQALRSWRISLSQIQG